MGLMTPTTERLDFISEFEGVFNSPTSANGAINGYAKIPVQQMYSINGMACESP